MTIKNHDLKKRYLKDPEVKAEYDRLGPEFELIDALINARVLAGLTQQQLAELMGTSQSVIARLESGHQLPSWKTLYRYAEATGTRPEIRFTPKEDDESRMTGS